MAFSSVVRGATHAIARAPILFFRQTSRIHHFAPRRPLLTGAVLHRGGEINLPCSFSPLAPFSSLISKKQSTDAELLRIIKSEIESAAEELREAEVPKGFPFEIQDEQGTNLVTLKREYLGENIEVVVSIPKMEDELDDEVDDGKAGRAGDEKASHPATPMTVNITKGKSLNLEFSCTAYPDEVVIDSLSVQRNDESEEDSLAYDGPDFNDLDENLQKAFHKFLELRGISPATTNFLYEYMIGKDDREYAQWLHNLKQFIEK
ncbi:hypothetical protein KSP40_PGU004988 [Platanthera guangdongensis]|uniref:Mitochondrial glycoprotein n=1 Tax=Platanthera guangdongensis TaxID=2320717 RepID=A0ABR2MB18_9ASPA